MTPVEISELFCRVLKLDTYPVAVELLADASGLFGQPASLKLNNCQLISLARHGGRYSSGIPERMVCSIGAACLGLVRTPDEFSDGSAAVGKYTSTAEAGRNFFSNTFKIGDEEVPYSAVQFAPLHRSPFVPSVLLVYGNPAQIMRLVHANGWFTGEKTIADTVAEAAVCSSIGLAIKTGAAVLGLPCAGDRRFGGTQNHEMVFVAPWTAIAGRIAPALAEMAENQDSLYPVAPSVLHEAEMPMAYTLKN